VKYISLPSFDAGDLLGSNVFVGVVVVAVLYLLSFARNSGRLTWVQQPQERRYPFLPVSAVFSCVQTTVQLPVFGIFIVRTDVDECDCTRGLYGHRKSARKAHSQHRFPAPSSKLCQI